MRSIGLFLFLGISGCVGMTAKEASNLLLSLSKDNASACIVVVGWYGAGTVPVVPTVGGSYGSITACRANERGSEITVTDDGVKLAHGIYEEKIDQKKLKNLEKMKDWIMEKGFPVFPGPTIP